MALALALGCAGGLLLGAPSVSAQAAQAVTPPGYDSVQVLQPANEATVHDNAGRLEVRVEVTPALRVAAGHRVALILDGKRIAVQSATHFGLSAITRGEHSLEARVLDANGNALIASRPIIFYMWQASRLFPHRRGN